MEIEHQLQGLQRQVKDLERELLLQEQLLRSTQEDLHDKQTKAVQWGEKVQELKRGLQGKQEQIDLVRGKMVEQRAWMELRVAERRFTSEYKSRQSYYQAIMKSPKHSLFTSIMQKSAGKLLLVSPETLSKRQKRVQQLLQQGNQAGFFCIECVPLQPGEEFWVREVAAGHVQTNAESYLLSFLLNRPVVVLTTWVLQCAWFDLLPEKVLWYDVSANLVEYEQGDVELQLYHWELLSGADVVSHAHQEQDGVSLLEQLKQKVRKVRGGAEHEKRILG